MLLIQVNDSDFRYATTINSLNEQPLSIEVGTTPPISLTRQTKEQEKINLDRRFGLNSKDRAINELRQLIRNR